MPADVILHIFTYLPARSAVHYGLASRLLYQIQKNEMIWKVFCDRELSVKSLPMGCPTWRMYYQQFESCLLLPFPCESMSFQIFPSKDWRFNAAEYPYVRQLTFFSYPFDEFSLWGGREGNVAIHVKVAKNVFKTVECYFKSLSFEEWEPFSILQEHFFFHTPNNRRKIFKVIKTFNLIDPDFLGLAERLASCNNWHAVTPLTKKEILILRFYKRKQHIAGWIQKCANKVKFSRF